MAKTLEERIVELHDAIAEEEDVLYRLELIQERLNAEEELRSLASHE